MDGEDCPSIDFLTNGEADHAASRLGLLNFLKHIAQNGFQQASAKWSHEADKRNGIYEFIKGDLRLFYFKGHGDTIAVTTGGCFKKGRKADPAMVAAAIRWKTRYEQAVADGTLHIDETEYDEDQQEN